MEPQTNTATSATNWRGRGGTPQELPSGNVALLRSPGMQHFLKTGQIPNSLRSIVQKAMNKKEGEVADFSEVMNNEQDLIDLFNLFDKIVLQVVVEPKVLEVPLDENGQIVPIEDRDMEAGIYVDEVDLADKSFIFQFATGGTKDLESFRSEQGAAMASLPPS